MSKEIESNKKIEKNMNEFKNNELNFKKEIIGKEKEENLDLKFKVIKNQKTSLIDPLDILKKEPKIIPIEIQLKNHINKTKNEIKVKRYISGLEITYRENDNKEMEIISINKNSVKQKILKNIESSLDSNLESYIKKLFCKFNYSPIIKKMFGKKITFLELEELSLIWRFYLEIKIINNQKSICEFRENLLKIIINYIKYLIKNIFSIMKIREAIQSIQNIFQIHYFHILKKDEDKNYSNAFNKKCIRLNINKEIEGNGCSFILLKELKRSLNMLIYSTKYLFYSFEYIFNNDFYYLYMIQRKIFYEYFIKNCFFSTLFYNIKGIFIRSDYKEVCNEIDNLTLPFEYDFDDSFIKEEYKNINIGNSQNECLYDFKKCYDQLGYSVDKNDEKGEDILIETEESKKVKEIKDIDELIKFIEDGSTKKKKRKKKKKENPINILDKIRFEEKQYDNELLSQNSLSLISEHDSIVSAFKRELRDDVVYNNFEKSKPQFSNEFLSKFY